MSSTAESSLRWLKEADRGIQGLLHIQALMAWDQETGLPAEAVETRAEQSALLEEIIHGRMTDPRTGEHLERLEVRADGFSPKLPLPALEQAFLREFRRRYLRRTRLPARLVTELARQSALGQARWAEARRKSDFALFAPSLAVIVELVREQARHLGYEEQIYDALLDDYEPWMKTSELERVFDRLGPRLRQWLERIEASPVEVDDSFLYRRYSPARQRTFSREVLLAIGYDFRRGRLDESVHPFTMTLGFSDVRLTTRYDGRFFNTGIFGTIHEGGHGLYEQGFAAELRGTLLADGTSMGIHESQSRMWENLIGRSLPFWRYFFPRLQALFPSALAGVDLEAFYRGINRVKPSLIRVEADEATYNLHILLRFHLEKRLLAGDLAVGELPEAWNEESRRLLGIAPPDDARGVLQDIHWSGGLFGYFPTYALGNLYAAQFHRAMRRDLPDLDAEIAAGRFGPVLNWLREKIHGPGRTCPARELCLQVTGESLNPDYFMEYLEEKFGAVYRL